MLNLSPEYQEYAKSLVKNTDDKEVSSGCVFHNEFIEWPDNPECWAGAWGDTHVLCIVTDYSLTNLQTNEMVLLNDGYQAKYSWYNVPLRLRKNIDQIVKYNGQNCTRSTITHQEWLDARCDASSMELETWDNDIKKYFDGSRNSSMGYPTVENPIKIHLVGTDDCSYSLCVDTRKAALEIVQGIKNTPTWDMINEYGFVFTN